MNDITELLFHSRALIEGERTLNILTITSKVCFMAIECIYAMSVSNLLGMSYKIYILLNIQ